MVEGNPAGVRGAAWDRRKQRGGGVTRGTRELPDDIAVCDENVARGERVTCYSEARTSMEP
jgi:hypothetical protein